MIIPKPLLNRQRMDRLLCKPHCSLHKSGYLFLEEIIKKVLGLAIEQVKHKKIRFIFKREILTALKQLNFNQEDKP